MGPWSQWPDTVSLLLSHLLNPVPRAKGCTGLTIAKPNAFTTRRFCHFCKQEPGARTPTVEASMPAARARDSFAHLLLLLHLLDPRMPQHGANIHDLLLLGNVRILGLLLSSFGLKPLPSESAAKMHSAHSGHLRWHLRWCGFSSSSACGVWLNSDNRLPPHSMCPLIVRRHCLLGLMPVSLSMSSRSMLMVCDGSTTRRNRLPPKIGNTART